MQKEQQQTSIALATALLNNDIRSFTQITHQMERKELRDVLHGVAALLVAALDQEQRAHIIGKIQELGVYVAGKDDDPPSSPADDQ
jgi:hypothetical protein